MTFTVAAANLEADWPWEGICVEALSVCGPSSCPSAGCTRRRGLFWGLRGNGPDWVGNDSRWVGPSGFGGRLLWRISGGRLVTQGKSTGRWFAGGRLWIGLVFRGLRGKWEGRGCFRDKKEAPLSSVVSGASGNFSLFQGSQGRHWKPVRSGCGLRFWTLKPGR